MSRKNKKAVLGVTITTFVATIFIILILLVFILISGVVKKTQTEGSRFDDKSMVGLKTYDVGLQNKMLFDFLIGCKGKFNNKEIKFYDVLSLWNSENTKEIKDFVVNSNCKVSYFEARNLKYEEFFWCNLEECKIEDPNTKYAKNRAVLFPGIFKGDYTDFEIPAINVEITISEYDLIKLEKEFDEEAALYEGVQ